MLYLEGVDKTFSGVAVLSNITLTLHPRDVLCISGPSGVGKSTLLEIMAGLIKPDQGLVTRNERASLAFQDDALLPWASARENILYILSAFPGNKDKAALRALADFWLERFELSPEAMPPTMSGGMRRRLNLARAFAADAPLLLLDEPFAFLDKNRQNKTAYFIQEAATAGKAVVVTSHDSTPLDALAADKTVNYRIVQLQQGMLL